MGLEQLLAPFAHTMPKDLEARVVAGRAHNEDAVVVNVPHGRHLLGHVDLIAPLVRDARAFGRIAACQAFMGIYAAGAIPWSSISIACFPESMANEAPTLLQDVLEGAVETMVEAGCVAAGGHTVKDDEMKFGLAVTGFVEPGRAASPANLVEGDVLVLTKPLGIGVLAMAVKACAEDHESAEMSIQRVAGRLDVHVARAIGAFGIRAANVVSRSGLAGHLLQMVQASSRTLSSESGNAALHLEIEAKSLPLMDGALGYARRGLWPRGSRENLEAFGKSVLWLADGCHASMAPGTFGTDDLGAGASGMDASGMDASGTEAFGTDALGTDASGALKRLFFDEQTSGGIVLGVPGDRVDEVLGYLREAGEEASLIGQVRRGRGERDAPVVVR